MAETTEIIETIEVDQETTEEKTKTITHTTKEDLIEDRNIAKIIMKSLQNMKDVDNFKFDN